jgi:drug/metabolite transporter (DMT)-like permease
MDIIIAATVGIILNISGAIITKYLTMNMDNILLLIVLLFSLFIALLLRVIYWVIIGKKYQLSFIYPLLSINYFLSFILGMILFNELYKPNRLIGSIIIIIGVMFVSYSSNKYEDNI